MLAGLVQSNLLCPVTPKARLPRSAFLIDGTTIYWNLNSANSAIVTLGGNRTLSASGMQPGSTYSIIVKQDSTGSRTLAYGSMFKWAGGTAPVLSTVANSVDILTFISDGTYLYGVCQKAFS